MEKKEMYVAPEVEIINVSVEKGFAATRWSYGGRPRYALVKQA